MGRILTFLEFMVNIDLKDRKILYELDLNCRQSNTQIGKKVGLRKDVVSYRIKRMQDEGIIKNFWTEINTLKLGYNVFRIYLNFQDVNPNLKDEIIQYFSSYKNTWAVMSVKGPIDLDIMLWVKDNYEFNQFWNLSLDKYGNYFTKQAISIFTGGVAFKKSYLLYDEHQQSGREYFVLKSGDLRVEIDKLDYKLLNELTENARIPLINLAEKFGCSSQIISYRIKNLIEKDIIKAFRVGIDISKLGLQNSVLDIYLKDHSQRKFVINYLKTIPYVEYLVESAGWFDIQLELMIKNIDHLTQIMEELDSKFPGVIRTQNFWMSKKYHRLRSLPEIDEKDLKK